MSQPHYSTVTNGSSTPAYADITKASVTNTPKEELRSEIRSSTAPRTETYILSQATEATVAYDKGTDKYGNRIGYGQFKIGGASNQRTQMPGVAEIKWTQLPNNQVEVIITKDATFKGEMNLLGLKKQSATLADNDKGPVTPKTEERPAVKSATREDQVPIQSMIAGLKVEPITPSRNKELFDLCKQSAELGISIVVSQSRDQTYTYQIKRGAQVIDEIRLNRDQENYHEQRDRALLDALTRADQGKATLRFNGSDRVFTKKVSPELYRYADSLGKLGLQLSFDKTPEGTFAASLIDVKTGYAGKPFAHLSKDDLFAIAQGKHHLPHSVHAALDVVKHRAHIMVEAHVSAPQYLMTEIRDECQKMPDDVIDTMLKEGVRIIGTKTVLDANPSLQGQEARGIRTDIGYNGASGIFTKSGNLIHIASESQYSNGVWSRHNHARDVLFHEVGHFIDHYLTTRNRFSEDDQKNLEIALALDNRAAGYQSNSSNPVNERAKATSDQDTLAYYANRSECFAESYEAILRDTSQQSNLIKRRFPHFYQCAREIIEREFPQMSRSEDKIKH